jgi:hypothetical protein
LLWFGECFGELAEEVEGVVAYAAVGFKEYGDYGVGGVLAAFVLFAEGVSKARCDGGSMVT